MQTPSSNTTEASFTMKGSLIPMTVLELVRYDPSDFERELKAKVAQAPAFFDDMPVVFALEKLEHKDQPIDFDPLVSLCTGMHIRPVAIRGGGNHHATAARASGLAILPATGKKAQPAQPVKECKSGATGQPVAEKPEIPERPETPTASEPTGQQADTGESIVIEKAKPAKIIYTPIRSGQQVYTFTFMAPCADAHWPG